MLWQSATAVRMWELDYRKGHAVADIARWMKRRADVIGVDLDWRQKHVRRRTCLFSYSYEGSIVEQVDFWKT